MDLCEFISYLKIILEISMRTILLCNNQAAIHLVSNQLFYEIPIIPKLIVLLVVNSALEFDFQKIRED